MTYHEAVLIQVNISRYRKKNDMYYSTMRM